MTTTRPEPDRKLLGDVLHSIACGVDTRITLSQLCLLLESVADNCLAMVMCLDESQQRLYLVAAPSLSADMRHLFTGITPGTGVGSCGACIVQRTLVAVEDTRTDPNWRNAQDLVHKTGVRACWSTPIIGAGERILGTLSLSSLKVGLPSEATRQDMALAAHLASIAMQLRGVPSELDAGSDTKAS